MKTLLSVLRRHVKQKAGLKRIYNKDCRHVSELIFLSTGRSISPSTLKRFFSLVKSNSTPSTYSLDTLSNFCGFSSFEEYSQKYEEGSFKNQTPESEGGTSPNIDLIRTYAEKHGNELFSEVALNKRILHRKAISDSLSKFVESDHYLVYPILAPAGFGKTITAFQFAKELSNKGDGNHLILLTKASYLAPVLIRNADLSACLKSILHSTSLNEQQLGAVLMDESVRKVFIIDAIDESAPFRNEVSRVFNAILNICIQLKNYPLCKLIFTQRSESWASCLKNSTQKPSFDDWFFDEQNSISYEQRITLPELTDLEIKNLWKLLTRKPYSHVLSARSVYFRSPNYIRILSRIKHGSGVTFSDLDIVNVYIQHLVYDAPESTGIRAILKKLVNSGQPGQPLPLSSLDKLITTFPVAWEELLGNHIIQVKSNSSELVRKPRVSFTHQSYLESIVALFWYQERDRKPNDVEQLFTLLGNRSFFKGVFENLFWVFYREHRLDLIIALLELDFDLNEKKALARSLFDVWHSDPEWFRHILPDLAGHKIVRLLYFEHLVPIDYLPGIYGEAIDSYLRNSETLQDKLFALSMLALKGILQMDMTRLSNAAEKIRSLDHDEHVHESPHVRSLMYCAVYDFLQGKHPDEIINKAVTITETALSDSAYPRPQMIMHLLAFGLWLIGDKERINRLYSKYKYRFKSDESVSGNEFEARFFLSLAAIFEDSGAMCHDYNYNMVEKMAVMDKGEQLTSQCIYDFIIAGFEIKAGQKESALKKLSGVIKTSEKNGYTLFEVLAKILKAEIENDHLERDRWLEFADERGFGNIANCQALLEDIY